MTFLETKKIIQKLKSGGTLTEKELNGIIESMKKEERKNKEEFEEHIKHEIEGIEGAFSDDDLKLLWLAEVHEASGRMLEERNLTPFGAFKKWKEAELCHRLTKRC